MPVDEEQIPAPEDVEQVVAVYTDVVKGWVGSDSNPDNPKVEVVVVALHFKARDTETDEPMQTLIVFAAEDARTLRHQLEVADSVKTVAAQISE